MRDAAVAAAPASIDFAADIRVIDPTRERAPFAFQTHAQMRERRPAA